jgi:ferrous iron transport protein A
MKAQVDKIALIEAQEGSTVTVLSIDSGLNCSGRLAELGIYPGETIRIVKNKKRGPVLVLVKESTFMLGRGMAEKIYVF